MERVFASKIGFEGVWGLDRVSHLLDVFSFIYRLGTNNTTLQVITFLEADVFSSSFFFQQSH